ncbi:MAG: aspartate ammonia-lyase [Alphaproteobacteria bacterium]|nr:aspartate ammonia-lyase [Alphaproteobacteria bacterium]
MPQRSRLSTTLSGIAGEYFVAAELSRRGYVASLTLKNSKGIDILASDSNATKSVGIQVKTHQGRGKDWILSQKVETDTASNLFFVFVRLNELEAVEYYVVPREDVSRFAADRHRKYLQTKGRNGQQRKDSSMRKFSDLEGKYLNRWDLLGLD